MSHYIKGFTETVAQLAHRQDRLEEAIKRMRDHRKALVNTNNDTEWNLSVSSNYGANMGIGENMLGVKAAVAIHDFTVSQLQKELDEVCKKLTLLATACDGVLKQ